VSVSYRIEKMSGAGEAGYQIDGRWTRLTVTIPGTVLPLGWREVCTSFGFADDHDLSFLLGLL